MRKRISKIVIFGTSGHALVCADILELQGYAVAGFIGKVKSDIGKRIEKFSVIASDGNRDLLTRIRNGNLAYFVGIGDNDARKRCTKAVVAATGQKPINAIHPDSLISRYAKLGTGNFVNCGVKVNASARIGDHTILNTAATIDHECTIKDYVQISPGCNIGGNVTVSERTFLGIGTVVIPGIRVGAGSIIGAGAVVIRDLPRGVTAVGVPARPIKKS